MYFISIQAYTCSNNQELKVVFSLLTQDTNVPSEVRVEGLETLDYLDNLTKERFTEQGDAIVFETEVTKPTQYHNETMNFADLTTFSCGED
jgi:hypothetical protein